MRWRWAALRERMRRLQHCCSPSLFIPADEEAVPRDCPKFRRCFQESARNIRYVARGRPETSRAHVAARLPGGGVICNAHTHVRSRTNTTMLWSRYHGNLP